MDAATLPQSARPISSPHSVTPAALQLLVFIAAFVVIALRRPDALFHARFYAEDGAIFYATAYNYGWWHVLFSPYQGYIHLLPRLVAGAALAVPLAFAPLVENIVAIALEAVPACLLLSPAWERWGSLRFRAVLACIYLALPNAGEIIGSITESQWILALCALLIVLAPVPRSKTTRALHGCLVALSSFTGPFCVFLLPFAVWKLACERGRWRKAITAILLIGALAQLAAYATHSWHRAHGPLGAGVGPLLRILGSQVYLGTLIGGNSLAMNAPRAALVAGILGTAFLLCIFMASRAELRALQIFAAAIFLAAITNPVASPPHGDTVWQWLARVSETRYWFFPCLASAWSIAIGIHSRHQLLKIIAVPLAGLMVLGIARDFRQPRREGFQFALHVQQFEQAPRGTTVAIPIYPRGWQAILVKH